jgi:hypothetical protein
MSTVQMTISATSAVVVTTGLFLMMMYVMMDED